MESVVLWLLMLGLVVWLAFTLRRSRSAWQRLADELEVWLPVFSAETTHGKEAEFLRERLPRRVPRLGVVLAAALLLAGAAVSWWLG
jgi:hypothetical protein